MADGTDPTGGYGGAWPPADSSGGTTDPTGGYGGAWPPADPTTGGGTATTQPGTVSTTSDGGGFWDKLGSWFSGGGAESVGYMGLIYDAYSQRDKPIPGQKELEATAKPALDAALPMIQAASRGELTEPQKAAIQGFKDTAKVERQQYFAKAGLSDSTMAIQSEQQVDQQALAMSQQFIHDTMAQGLTALGMAQGPYTSIMQAQVQKDAALQEAIANAMGAWGAMQARGGGGGGGMSKGGALGSALGMAAGGIATGTPLGAMIGGSLGGALGSMF